MSHQHPYTAAYLGGEPQPMSGAAFTSDGAQAQVGIVSVEPVGLHNLNLAEKVVTNSGVKDLIAGWRIEDGYDPKKGGRPSMISDRLALVLMAMLAIGSKPMHIQLATDIITQRATNDLLRRFGLPSRGEEDYVSADGRWAWYMKLHRAWKRIHDVLDPYDDVQLHKRMDRSEFDEIVSMRNIDRIKARMARLVAFNNALVRASVDLMPDEHKSAWRGDVCVDGTPIPAAKTGTTRSSSRVSSEPDAGWYVREGEHRGDEKRDGAGKLMWAYEATIATQTFEADELGTPSLIMGVSLDKPGHRIAENAKAALDSLINDPNAPKGHFMGDRAYLSGSKPEKLQIPLRQAGYRMMGDQSQVSRGLQATYEGAELIGGTWYFPGMPKAWKTASEDYATGLISMSDLGHIVDERQSFALIVKFIGDDGSVTFKSPARDRYATLRVDGIPVHKDAVSRKLRKVFKTNLPKGIEHTAVWKQKQLRIPVTEGAKFAQQGPAWGTQEWANIYRRGRNTIESRNRLVKNNRLAMGDHTRRLMRGFTNAAMIVALGAVAVNLHLISAFIADLSTGRPRVKRGSVQAQCERFTSLDTMREMASNSPPVAA